MDFEKFQLSNTFSKIFVWNCILIVFILLTLDAKKPENKPEWTKKPITEYNDADVERLFEQWEEDEEPLEEDELPEYLRKTPNVDWSKIDFSDPDAALKASKKGKVVMSFVSLTGLKSKQETEEVTKLWQTSLWNNHMQVDRYVVDDFRVLFVFQDGSQAWDAKDFIIQQDHCKDMLIEGKTYIGKDHHNLEVNDKNKTTVTDDIKKKFADQSHSVKNNVEIKEDL